MKTKTFNLHNLKKGDKFKIKSFLGDIVITDIFESYFKVNVRHLSGVDYYASCSFTDFNNAMKSGKIVSLVRS
jgi:hypothetical protein